MNLELELIVRFLAGNATSAKDIPWALLRREDVLVIREWLAETQPAIVQRRAVRAVRAAMLSGEGRQDEYDPTTLGKLTYLRRKPSFGRQLSKKQAHLLVEASPLDTSLGVVRDSAVIALMLLAGLKRCEVVS